MRGDFRFTVVFSLAAFIPMMTIMSFIMPDYREMAAEINYPTLKAAAAQKLLPPSPKRQDIPQS